MNKLFGGHARILYSNDENIRKSLKESVGLINAVYPMPDSKTIITREHVRLLPEKGVIVDVGGELIETCHYTTLENPTYTEEGVIHYCVDNAPSLVAKLHPSCL